MKLAKWSATLKTQIIVLEEICMVSVMLNKKITKLVWITSEDVVFDLLYRHFTALDTKQTFQPVIAKCIGVAREDMH